MIKSALKPAQSSFSSGYSSTSGQSSSSGQSSPGESRGASLQQAISKVQLRKVKTECVVIESTNSSPKPRVTQTKSMSDIQIKNFYIPKSPDAPKLNTPKLPTAPSDGPVWKNAQLKSVKVNSNETAQIKPGTGAISGIQTATITVNGGESKITNSASATDSGVDERAPGGVNTLINRFNLKPTQEDGKQQLVKKGKLPYCLLPYYIWYLTTSVKTIRIYLSFFQFLVDFFLFIAPFKDILCIYVYIIYLILKLTSVIR